ncbi:phosphocarrier protein HPr [Lysobacteraceae bacterium NML120232]|nr:phosphocarrier protein HPr [Xanthomonadaceae bacterium NML08-0793]PJK13323.1 phosphocarrier protein HPr [Xanthomonadaceae bacterium NML120232]
MLEREIIVSNKLGLHARASAKLVQLLSGFKSRTKISHRGREVDAKSIMGVMMLAAGQGSPIVLRIDGEDEAEAMQQALALFARKFDEDQ